MAAFTAGALVLVGFLALMGGVYQAVIFWPEDSVTSALIADPAKTISLYWLASSIASWAVFWGLAAIISELELVRYTLVKALSNGYGLDEDRPGDSADEEEKYSYEGETITRRLDVYYIGEEVLGHSSLERAKSNIDIRKN